MDGEVPYSQAFLDRLFAGPVSVTASELDKPPILAELTSPVPSLRS